MEALAAWVREGAAWPGATTIKLPDTAEADSEGPLRVGGIDLVELARDFGTPLFVYDEAHLRSRAAFVRRGSSPFLRIHPPKRGGGGAPTGALFSLVSRVRGATTA